MQGFLLNGLQNNSKRAGFVVSASESLQAHKSCDSMPNPPIHPVASSAAISGVGDCVTRRQVPFPLPAATDSIAPHCYHRTGCLIAGGKGSNKVIFSHMYLRFAAVSMYPAPDPASQLFTGLSSHLRNRMLSWRTDTTGSHTQPLGHTSKLQCLSLSGCSAQSHLTAVPQSTRLL